MWDTLVERTCIFSCFLRIAFRNETIQKNFKDRDLIRTKSQISHNSIIYTCKFVNLKNINFRQTTQHTVDSSSSARNWYSSILSSVLKYQTTTRMMMMLMMMKEVERVEFAYCYIEWRWRRSRRSKKNKISQ